ncbi:helicase associated domain-containing protein [Streptomyces sp. NBC_01563]|uniref:helicase associated domain-containing protein n=2 Tax=unclassified Streptomyces TaxID=2593676 RepID=UPI00386DB396
MSFHSVGMCSNTSRPSSSAAASAAARSGVALRKRGSRRRTAALTGRNEAGAAGIRWPAPGWPADWQRHFAVVREMLAEESILAYVEPGVTVHGMDIGKWLAKQRKPEVWAALTGGQRERLEAIGVVPMAAELEALAKPSTTPVGAFERGVAALAQYKAREGSLKVPRAHVERLEDGSEVKLGVFLSNSKSRRAKLTADKLQALAALGLEWAA